jgi:hypothetical protein
MTSLEEKKLLKDILNAIISIDEHLEGRRSFEEYKANKTKRSRRKRT